MEPGLHRGLSFADYLKLDAINKSGLDYFRQSPAHYFANCMDPARDIEEPTPAMKLGTAIHAAVLEPVKFGKEYAAAPKVDRRTKEGKATWEEFCVKNEGKEILTDREMEICNRVCGSVRSNPAATVLLHRGDAEITVIWIDPETQVKCKARIDWLTDDRLVILDLKSTMDASPTEFGRQVANFNWEMQAAWYLDGLKHAIGVEATFVIGALEKEAPFAAAFYHVPEDVLAVGRAKYREALHKYAAAKKSGEWEAYPTDIMPLHYPAWALKNAQVATEVSTGSENQTSETLPY